MLEMSAIKAEDEQAPTSVATNEEQEELSHGANLPRDLDIGTLHTELEHKCKQVEKQITEMQSDAEQESLPKPKEEKEEEEHDEDEEEKEEEAESTSECHSLADLHAKADKLLGEMGELDETKGRSHAGESARRTEEEEEAKKKAERLAKRLQTYPKRGKGYTIRDGRIVKASEK